MGGSAIEDDWDITLPVMGNSERTVVLVGRTGNGKSATGNSILGRKVFKSRASSAGVTSTCEKQKAVLIDGQVINVIDTPGLFDFSYESDNVGKEIVKCIELAKEGIHAVIVVFSVRTRFSQEELAALRSLQTLFGSKIVNYMIVVFTGGDELEDNDETLEDYIGRDCPDPLKEILVLCENRRVLFDNKTKDERKKFEQVQQLLSLVNIVVSQNGGKPYMDELFVEMKEEDKRFDSFKTWSGRLERQLTNLRGKSPRAPEPEEEFNNAVQNAQAGSLPVDRYFDALEGPELDTLRASEEIMLPEDKKWPFLLRFSISSFGICLGVSSQAIMWKTLAGSPSTHFLHISPMVNLVLWIISIALVVSVSCIYLLKIIFYFEAVRREYYHPIRVNFFFAPWIALLFLALGVPASVANNLHQALWYVLMAPIFVLEVKIYGQWMSGGQRRLSKVANPSNHLSVVGNFVGALLGASMGLKEGPIFFFAIGLAHYTVLFVTLYQRLPTNETLPKELHPVFFLFVAAPSVASMAWAKIQGSFDHGSRIAFFIALFLYFSLAVRVNFFRGFKFSLAWWAYTFPMTGAAIATIKYSNEVTNVVTQALSVTLCAVSTLIVTSLLVTTILHAFVLRDLFPNDIAIAISNRKPKPSKNWFPHFHLRHGSSETREIENYLKFACKEGKDLEASLKSHVQQNSTNNV